MTDLRSRFAETDQVRMPDVWGDVEARSREIADGRAPRFSEPTRRHQRVVAGIVAFAVFALAAGFAWSALRPATPDVPTDETGGATSYQVPKLGLQFNYPREWHVQPFDEPDLLPMSGPFFGALVSNVGRTIGHPDLGRNSATSAWDMRALPAKGVVISIERIDDTSLPSGKGPDTPLPLSLADARPTHQAYAGGGSWVWRPFRLGGIHINFRVWFGSKATKADRAIASRIVSSIRPIGPSTGEPSPRAFPIPDVSGLPLTEAEAALRGLRLHAIEVTFVRKLPVGIVGEQSPSPGTEVDLSDTVTLEVGTAAKFIHGSHQLVPRAVSANCPIVRGVATPSSTTGAPGTTVTVSGAVYHRVESGRLDLLSRQDYEVWWDLPESRWTSVANGADAIARGTRSLEHQPRVDPIVLGDYRPNGACSISAQFVVPDVPPGTYPVGIIAANGAGSTTLYGWFEFKVVASPPAGSGASGSSTP